jgi:hypothetical protein
MKQPVYRWVCVICGISDEAESSEMARLNIDLHVQVAHTETQEAVHGPADDQDDRGGATAPGGS